MAAISFKYPLGSAQQHIKTCEKHDLTIDIICEDCDGFICSRCAKTDHKDHDDYFNSHVHLLSPDGDFFKYLLTENGVRNPSSMSLYKSTLWVVDKHGHVKVLQYNEN